MTQGAERLELEQVISQLWARGRVIVGLIAAAAYSLPPLQLSRRGALASVLLPAGYVGVPFLTGIFAVRPTIDAGDIALLAGLWIGFIGRILLKDFRDIKGDMLFGKRTFLIRHGRRFTCRPELS